MKKITMVSLVVTAIIFAGCNEKTEKVVTDTATKTVETVKEANVSIPEPTKEVATAVVEKAEESVAKVAEAVVPSNESFYTKCAGCHGADGKTKALGKSEVITGQSKEELVTKLNEYKAGTRNVAGMGALMKGQVATLSDADIDAVSTYIATLK